jgi:hypothetical protein
MINNIAGYALSIVGAIFIGRLGALPLSASVLANSLYNCTGLSLALGLSAGMETLCGAAYGAGAYLRVGVILQRALLVCWTVCLPVVLLWSQVCAFRNGCPYACSRASAHSAAALGSRSRPWGALHALAAAQARGRHGLLQGPGLGCQCPQAVC